MTPPDIEPAELEGMMEHVELVTIPARKGKAARIKKGQIVRVVNTHGQQVVDTWAFSSDDLGEFMSMEHSRVAFGKVMPTVGDSFVTNRRRPVLTIVEDTSEGVHDTLLAACDRYRYELLGCAGYHDNCTDNLAEALTELGLDAPGTPSPLNIFMNTPIVDGNSIDWRPPVTKAGDYMALRAEMDCIIVFSACPQDMVPINGKDHAPTEAHFSVS